MPDYEKYTTTLQRTGKQVYIPEMILTLAGIERGDYLEVTVRKTKKKYFK